MPDWMAILLVVSAALNVIAAVLVFLSMRLG